LPAGALTTYLANILSGVDSQSQVVFLTVYN